MKAYFVYIVTNKGRTTLYTGVTNSLIRRISQHRNEEIDGFSKRYHTNCLVFFETFNDVKDAIVREKQLKGWSRKKKEALICESNPNWTDLGETVLGLGKAPATQWKSQDITHAGDPSTSSG